MTMTMIDVAYANGAQHALDKFASGPFIKEALTPALLRRAASAAGHEARLAKAAPDAALAAGRILPRAEMNALGERAARKARQPGVFESGAAARENPRSQPGRVVPLGAERPKAIVARDSRKVMQDVYDKYNPGVPLGQGTAMREDKFLAMSGGPQIANRPTVVREPRAMPNLTVPEHSQVFTSTPYNKPSSGSGVFAGSLPTVSARPLTGRGTFNSTGSDLTANARGFQRPSAATQILG